VQRVDADEGRRVSFAGEQVEDRVVHARGVVRTSGSRVGLGCFGHALLAGGKGAATSRWVLDPNRGTRHAAWAASRLGLG
jgi:hypothetical protein